MTPETLFRQPGPHPSAGTGKHIRGFNVQRVGSKVWITPSLVSTVSGVSAMLGGKDDGYMCIENVKVSGLKVHSRIFIWLVEKIDSLLV